MKPRLEESWAENELPNMAKKSQAEALFPRARLAGLIGKQLAKRTVLTVLEGHDQVLNTGTGVYHADIYARSSRSLSVSSSSSPIPCPRGLSNPRFSFFAARVTKQ